MSFEIDISSVVCSMKEALLPRSGYDRVQRAIAFKLDLRISHYFDAPQEDVDAAMEGVDENDTDAAMDATYGLGESHASRMVFFMFYGNTSVWMAVEGPEDRWFNASNIPVDRWENTSNHDSCWRDDGVRTPLFNLYMELCDKVKAGVPDGDKLAPISLSQHCSLGFCGSGPFEFVTVTTENQDRRDGNSFWSETVLVDISPITEE